MNDILNETIKVLMGESAPKSNNEDSIRAVINDAEFLTTINVTPAKVIDQVKIAEKDFQDISQYVHNFKGIFGELYTELKGWNLLDEDVSQIVDNMFDCYYNCLLITVKVNYGKLSVSPNNVYVFPKDITTSDSEELFQLDFDKAIDYSQFKDVIEESKKADSDDTFTLYIKPEELADVNISSLLFDSDSTIATYGNDKYELSLMCRGDVKIVNTENGEVYKNYQSFPDDLKALIKSGKLHNGTDKYYIDMNNWFEWFVDDKNGYNNIWYDVADIEGELNNSTASENEAKLKTIMHDLFYEIIENEDKNDLSESKNMVESNDHDTDEIVKKFVAPDNLGVEIIKAPNGRYFNRYYSDINDEHYNSTAGPFDSLEDAEKMVHKHRPTVKEVIEESSSNNKIIYTFEVYIDGLQSLMFDDSWSINDAKQEYLENEGAGHTIEEVKVHYFEEPVIVPINEAKTIKKPQSEEEKTYDMVKQNYGKKAADEWYQFNSVTRDSDKTYKGKKVKTEDLSIEEENNLADDVYKYLTDNQFYPNDVFAADTRVMVDISWGDWKHDHLYCDNLMKAKGYTLVEEEVTEEDGSDCYSAIRHYEPTGKFDNVNIDENQEVKTESTIEAVDMGEEDNPIDLRALENDMVKKFSAKYRTDVYDRDDRTFFSLLLRAEDLKSKLDFEDLKLFIESLGFELVGSTKMLGRTGIAYHFKNDSDVVVRFNTLNPTAIKVFFTKPVARDLKSEEVKESKIVNESENVKDIRNEVLADETLRIINALYPEARQGSSKFYNGIIMYNTEDIGSNNGLLKIKDIMTTKLGFEESDTNTYRYIKNINIDTDGKYHYKEFSYQIAVRFEILDGKDFIKGLVTLDDFKCNDVEKIEGKPMSNPVKDPISKENGKLTEDASGQEVVQIMAYGKVYYEFDVNEWNMMSEEEQNATLIDTADQATEEEGHIVDVDEVEISTTLCSPYNDDLNESREVKTEAQDKTNEDRITEIAKEIVEIPIIKKHILNHTWLSGSSTVVYPVYTYLDTDGTGHIDIQLNTKRNYFDNVIQQIKDKYSEIVDGRFNKTDDSCPSTLEFRYAPDKNKKTEAVGTTPVSVLNKFAKKYNSKVDKTIYGDSYVNIAKSEYKDMFPNLQMVIVEDVKELQEYAESLGFTFNTTTDVMKGTMYSYTLDNLQLDIVDRENTLIYTVYCYNKDRKTENKKEDEGELRKIKEYKDEIEDFIKQCEDSGKFDNFQIKRILEGFACGLTIEQVKFYATPKFNDRQMYEIIRGFENGLSLEQIQVYADPKFDEDQMSQIRKGFESGLNLEQIQVYADTKFDYEQMDEIRTGFESGLTIKQVRFYASPIYNREQMEKIQMKLKNGYYNLGESKEEMEYFNIPRYTVYDYADGNTMDDEETKGLEPSQFTIYDNEVEDFYYDESGNNPVFDKAEDAENYIKQNLNESENTEDIDKMNLDYIKDILQKSGIQNEKTLDLMSKDVLKDLKNNYADDCKTEAGLYYGAVITDAIQNKIAQITGKRPPITFKGESKKVIESNSNKIITITDGNSSTELDYNSLDFGLGDYYYDGNYTGAQIGFTWDEEAGPEYVENLSLTVYVGNADNSDLYTPNKWLINRTPDEAYKVTLSPEDYKTFLKWKDMCDVEEFTYWNELSEGKKIAENIPEDYDKNYKIGYNYLKSLVGDGDYYEIFEDSYKYPYGLTLVIYADEAHEQEDSIYRIDLENLTDEIKKITETVDPEEGFEINTDLAWKCNDIHHNGIFTTYIEDTNTLLFTKEKPDGFSYNDEDDIDTIVYRNQTPEEIKEYIDSLVNKNECVKMTEAPEKDSEEYNRLCDEIRYQAEDNSFTLTEDDIRGIADKMIADKFFFNHDIFTDDNDEQAWEEINNLIIAAIEAYPNKVEEGIASDIGEKCNYEKITEDVKESSVIENFTEMHPFFETAEDFNYDPEDDVISVGVWDVDIYDMFQGFYDDDEVNEYFKIKPIEKNPNEFDFEIKFSAEGEGDCHSNGHIDITNPQDKLYIMNKINFWFTKYLGKSIIEYYREQKAKQ